MCPNCTTVHPALAAQVATMSRAGLRDLVARIDHLLADADRIENRYRENGVDWATSQQAARDFCAGSPLPQSVFRCKEAFDLTFPRQYEELFAPLTNLVQRLSAFRFQAQHVPSSATAEHLLHVLSHELLPAMDALIVEFKAIEQRFTQLSLDVTDIVDVSRDRFETDNNGVRVCWHDFTGANDTDRSLWHKVDSLRSAGVELQAFRAWVRTLPETQRTLARSYDTDAELDRIALDLLWREGDEYEK
jgi:hypothetical protein